MFSQRCRPSAFGLFLLCSVCSAQVTDAHRPTLEGFVTDPGTPEMYRVNDTPVHCQAGTSRYLSLSPDGRLLLGSIKCPQLQLGQKLSIEGRQLHKPNGVEALEVTDTSPRTLTLAGYALIDKVLAPLKDGSVTVRADGLPIALTPTTRVDFDASETRSLTAAQPNTWLTYKGTLTNGGVLQADTIVLTPNTVGSREGQMRKEYEFKAADVDYEHRQNLAERALLGVDPERLPAFHSPAVQAHLDEVGQRLIPEYQKHLAASDPTHIDFRFQLIDDAKIHDAIATPNGIILVPHQVVEHLENDSQLAAVLADSIACILEKRGFRAQGATKQIDGANIAGATSLLVFPAASVPFFAGGATAASVLQRRVLEQDSRVSLGLLHEAGFDLREAPRAYWLLAQRGKHPLSETPMPYHVAYLYMLLFQVWTPAPVPQQ